MGDIADYYRNQELDDDFKFVDDFHKVTRELKRLDFEYELGSLEWHSGVGKINIKDMSDYHIENAANFIMYIQSLHYLIVEKWLDIFGRELIRRKVYGNS